MDLAGEFKWAPTMRGFRDDTFDGDEAGVDERRKNGGGRALDVADLLGAGVEYLDGIGIVGVADETDGLAAADGAAVVAEADDVGDDEAGEEEIIGRGRRRGRRRRRRYLGRCCFFFF